MPCLLSESRMLSRLGRTLRNVIQFMKPWTQCAYLCAYTYFVGANGQETACSEYFWNWIKTILDRGQGYAFVTAMQRST